MFCFQPPAMSKQGRKLKALTLMSGSWPHPFFVHHRPPEGRALLPLCQLSDASSQEKRLNYFIACRIWSRLMYALTWFMPFCRQRSIVHTESHRSLFCIICCHVYIFLHLTWYLLFTLFLHISLPVVLWSCLLCCYTVHCNAWVMRCWHGYLSGVRCKWFAYDQADATYGQADITTTWSSLALGALNSNQPTVSCFIKIHIGLTFLVPVYPGCREKEAVKRVSYL